MKTKKADIMKKYYLFLTVFITGASVMIIELVGTRILSPFYGTTIYVWSSLITVALVFLALGYFFGGRLADRKPQLIVLYLLVFLTGVSIFLIGWLDSLVLQITDFLGSRWGALSSAFILFSLPFLLLGMVIPYAIKGKARKLAHIGATSGNIYAVSTLGSFVGTISTGFVLIPNLSISSILTLVALGLFVVSVIGIVFERRHKWLFLMVFFLLMPFLPSPILELKEGIKIIYSAESPYAQIKVVDKQNLRFLLLNGATHTRYDLNKGEFNFPYLRLMEKAVNYHSNARNALVLGLGGGGLDKRLQDKGLEVDNVEIDPKVVEVAKEYFGFNGKVIIDDARTYVRKSKKKYDLIMFDVLSGYSAVPHLLTKEAFAEMKDILKQRGILTVNTLGFESRHSTEDPYEKALFKTLNKVFPYIYVKATGYGFNSIVFYCSDYPLVLDKWFISIEIFPDKETPILTDNYNPVVSLTIPHVETWRESIMSTRWLGEAVLH